MAHQQVLYSSPQRQDVTRGYQRPAQHSPLSPWPADATSSRRKGPSPLPPLAPSAPASPSWQASLLPVVVVVGWYTASGFVDTINEEQLLLGMDAAMVALLTSVFSVLVSAAVVYWMYTPAHYAMLLRWPVHTEVVVAGAVNYLALWAMYAGFGASNMTQSYALKTAEPLFTCLIASYSPALVYRSWRGHGGGTVPPSVWGSVAVICAGAFLMGVGTGPRAAMASWLPPLQPASLVLFSNFLFATRTVAQKPLLLNTAVPSSTSATAPIPYTPTTLFAHVGGVSLVVAFPVVAIGSLLLPGLATGVRVILMQPLNVLNNAFLVGAAYFAYHCLGNVVLQRLTPVSYAIAKQMRMVAVLLWSAAFFRSQFTGAAVVGLGVLAAGTVWYAQVSAALHQLGTEAGLSMDEAAGLFGRRRRHANLAESSKTLSDDPMGPFAV
jgi:hypothetical protein